MPNLPVVEIFGPTIQGEGVLAGHRTMFVRFGGCDGISGHRDWCTWCDSMHAVDPANKQGWRWLQPEDIVDELQRLAPWCKYVTLSGGNPALLHLESLIADLQSYDYLCAIETQGTVWRDWMAKLDTITVSPKPPSAGGGHTAVVKQFEKWMEEAQYSIDSQALDTVPQICVKPVVDVEDERDFAFAEDIVNAIHVTLDYLTVQPYLSVMTHPADENDEILDKWRTLIAWATYNKEIGEVAVLPQLHVLLWGHKLGV